MGTAGTFFYRPSYGTSGVAEYTLFDTGLAAADTELSACSAHRASLTITGTTFSGTNVYATTVTATTLSGTTFSGTNVYADTITGTTFSGTNVYATTVTATNLTAVSVSATSYENLPTPGTVNIPAYLVWGSCVWISSFTFGVQGQGYFSGTLTTVPYTSVTLSAADVTYDRIDVIVLESDGTADKITGDATATPSEPDYDPTTQIKLAIVTVPAGGTQPSDVVETTLYAETVEWTYTDSGTTIVNNSTANPHAGTYSIAATNPVPNNWFQLTTAGAAFDINTYTWLSLWIAPRAAFGSRYFRLRWRNGTTLRGNYVSITHGSFGFNSSSTAYQQIVIPISMFAVSTTTPITNLRVEFIGGSGAHTGWYVDDITIQSYTGPVGAVTSHHDLTGLDADDHPQYLLTNAARASTSSLTSTIFWGSTAVSGVTISGTTLCGANVRATTITATTLSGTTFSGENVKATTITATTLTGTTFSGTNVYATTVTATNLSGTTFSGTNVYATTVTATNISGTTFSASDIYVTGLVDGRDVSEDFDLVVDRLALRYAFFYGG